VKGGHAAALGAGLRAIADYDTEGQVTLYSDQVLRPWVFALTESPDYLSLDLVAILRKHDPFKTMKLVDKALANGQIEGSPRILYRKMFAINLRDAVKAVAA
jgi:hypothetical protein